MNLVEYAIKVFCDKFLANGAAYRGRIPVGESMTKHVNSAGFIYQDGTACSASHAFADVCECENGYIVYVDSSFRSEFSDPPIDIEKFYCANLCEVVDILGEFSCHDPNSCGELLLSLAKPKDGWENILGKYVLAKEISQWGKRDEIIPILHENITNADLAREILQYVEKNKPYNNVYTEQS